MKLILGIISIAFLFSNSCGTITIKPFPEHSGVDPALKPLVDEYIWLSKQNNITFSDEVSVGFKEINYKDTIGLCIYGAFWREVDIDTKYWKTKDSYQKLALIFHELTHCYCTRGHDYGESSPYPETDLEILTKEIKLFVTGERPGHWEDGCPVTIMHPMLIDSRCMQTHYNEYIKEMFDRCNPW